jgi:hypothetical protein
MARSVRGRRAILPPRLGCAQLGDIEKRYYTAKGAPAAGRTRRVPQRHHTAEDIVKEVFDDIAADYEASLPRK